MGSSTKEQAEELRRAVSDTMLYGFRPDDAIRYIEVKTGRTVTRDHYMKVRRFIESEASVALWLNGQARVGFIYSQRRNLEIIQKQQQELLNDILKESLKPTTTQFAQDGKTKLPRRNDWLLLNQRKALAEMVRLEFDMTMELPLLAKLKAMSVQDGVAQLTKEGGVVIDKARIEELWRIVDSRN